jgi:HEAT repeats
MRVLRAACVVLLFVSFSAEWPAVPGLGKGENAPGFYELTARSELVVLAQVVSGSLKRAQVRVTEVFRGAAQPGQRLEVAFRDFNNELPKEDRIVFTDGDTEVLFLVPELDLEDKPRGKDRYTLTRGRFGRYILPREGSGVVLEAMREFSRLVALKDHRQLFTRLKDLLYSPNPILADAAMSEVLKLDLMEKSLAQVVMTYYRDPAPKRRIAALRLMGRLFESTPGQDRTPEFQTTTLSPVAVLARNDPDEDVRVTAVDTLGKWGGVDVRETLKEVSRQDPAQAVRYEAQVILLRQGGTRGETRTDSDGLP